MKANIILIFSVLFFYQFALAKLPECEKGKIKNLSIGYTYGPDYYVEKAFNEYARRNGLKLKHELTGHTGYVHDTYIIPGGEDIDPQFYWQRISAKAQDEIQPLLHLVINSEDSKIRDQYEMGFIDNYINRSQTQNLAPLYGICRGMQILLVNQGIPLYIDIKTQLKIPNRINIKEKIMMENKQKTFFYQIFGNFFPKFYAMEWHHQGANVNYLSDFQDQFDFTSYSNQNLILESFEFKHLPILGVQFHPEASDRKIKKAFFESVLNKACAYKNSLSDNGE